jgi:signal transduction histidine kinase
MDETRLRRLLDVGRSLIAELDPDAVLRRLLDVARELTGARYAAIGVLDERREQLEQFITAGIDEDTHREIGDLPRGRGVLGVLIDDPQPLRLRDVGMHPRSYGFPIAHPPMTTFLGTPIVIEGQAWGNLYLTEKAGGEEFTSDDEDAVGVLADWAAIAIANSRLYRDVRQRRDELERTMRSLETMTEVTRALGGETDLDRMLELVAKRSRALIQARAAEITLLEGDEFVIAAVAGQGVEGLRGTRVPVDESLARMALESARPQRFDEIEKELFASRVIGARTAIVTPMVFKNRPVGFLMAFDRLESGRFSEEDERLLQAFAASAATAVATAQTAGNEALRRSMEASERERRRWARELHDETLQQLAGLRVMLAAARRTRDPERTDAALAEALELIADGIGELRGIITELRPASLDELGAKAAIEALVARVSQQSGLEIDAEINLAYEDGTAEHRHTTEVESTIYRLVQEALTNVVKHAQASHVDVLVDEGTGAVEVDVRDDGRGFDSDDSASGFGLLGMRERVALVDGTLDVSSEPGVGTTVHARIPVLRREPALPA